MPDDDDKPIDWNLLLPAFEAAELLAHKLGGAIRAKAEIADRMRDGLLSVFTDVLLTNGASRVYAVDSGTNQLAWKLRNDPRVVVHEQTNARNLTDAEIPEPVDIIVCDASFISLAKVLAAPLSFAKPGAHLIALIKPQFEAGRAEVGKGGVVRDPVVHERVCEEVSTWITEHGWSVAGITASPITGPEGNVEFLIGATLPAEGAEEPNG